MAGAALGAPQCHFAWQVQHSEHLSVTLRGRCNTRRTSVAFCVTGAALGAPPERSAKVRGTWRTSVSFCVAGAALGAPPESPTTIEYYGRRLLLRARCSTRTSVSFCVAGAALGASHCHFVWQVQHLEDLSVILLNRCSTRSTSREVCESPATIDYCGCRLLLSWHLEDLSLILRSRCSTGSTSREPDD